MRVSLGLMWSREEEGGWNRGGRGQSGSDGNGVLDAMPDARAGGPQPVYSTPFSISTVQSHRLPIKPTSLPNPRSIPHPHATLSTPSSQPTLRHPPLPSITHPPLRPQDSRPKTPSPPTSRTGFVLGDNKVDRGPCSQWLLRVRPPEMAVQARATAVPGRSVGGGFPRVCPVRL